MKVRKSGNRGECFFLVLGIMLIAISLLANEFILALLFSGDGNLQPATLNLIRVLNLVLIAGGLLAIVFRRTKGIINFCLLAGTLIIFLSALEIILRVPGWRKRGELPFNIADEYLHHTLRPNSSGIAKWGSREALYHTNSLGYRDASIRNIDFRTAADERILFLGDSFTEGVGVPWEDTFIGLLEEAINRTGRSVEILNAGIIGYAPSLAHRKLKQFLAGGYESDSVILMLDISDVYDEAVFYDGWERRGPSDPILGRSNYYPMILRQLSSRLKSLARTVSPPGEQLPHPEERTWTEFPRGRSSWVEDGLKICQENIIGIAELCRTNGMDFILVIYPQPTQLASEFRPSLAQEIYWEFSREQGIELIDLFEAFFLLEDWQDCFIPGDIHWNSRGHRLIAQALLKRLNPGAESQ